MNRVETNGVELACEAFGAPSDQAILLVAGLGTQMIRWTVPFCLALAARGYHVIRFDNRDAGASTHLTHRAAGHAAPPHAAAFFGGSAFDPIQRATDGGRE